MRSLVLGIPVAITAVVAGAPRAHADSITDAFGPREIAVGEAMRGNAVGQIGADVNPSGIPLNRELVFEGGYGYRSSDSATLIGVSACDSTSGMPGCFFYDYAGSSPEFGPATTKHTTHVGGLALSRVLVPRILIGGTVKYFHFASDAGESDASGTTFDLGATVRVTDMINLGVSAQNLWASSDTPEFPRAVGGGLYAHPIPLLGLSFDARWRIDGMDKSARYGGGAELFLSGSGGQSGFPIRIGALHDNGLDATYFSGGLGYASAGWSIDVGGRRQIKGGDDTMVLASMRFFGPRMPSPGVE